ncbi:cytidine deaminase [Aestuariibacter halophilus]|uniref:Cytidine deaminase n=1 Tax=Fluctibacter halophilus TaxID=226011 RepID=A0ABS8G643_9ALTE|nr:cytidine deaminase [Aestuariibacter halophilus]MCC2615330.1 cytidine deaminase [Aestuariibacter halophilus]
MPQDTQSSLQPLFEAALKVQAYAHAPYSTFKVGAAIKADDGNLYVGCNVENVSYPLGQCAEASAIGAMISQGAKRIEQVMIVSPNSKPCPPCGGCRQKLREFASPQTPVHLATRDGKVETLTLGELLPKAFDM